MVDNQFRCGLFGYSCLVLKSYLQCHEEERNSLRLLIEPSVCVLSKFVLQHSEWFFSSPYVIFTALSRHDSLVQHTAPWPPVLVALLTTSPPFLNETSLSSLWGTLNFHAGDVSCKAPLEQDVRVRRLVITVQLPAREVFSESLRTCGHSCITGSFTGISSWKVHKKWHRSGKFKRRFFF